MKILFINPTKIDKKGNLIKLKKSQQPPFTFAILHGLTHKSHEVDILDEYVENIDFSLDYDLIGLTATTPQANRAYQIADTFRNKGKRVIMGGYHASVNPEEAKEHADSIAIGEVEDIWNDILTDFEKGTYKEYYRSDVYPSLSNVPIPRWEKINFKNYIKPIGAKNSITSVYTTRGCKFNCKFCSVHKINGKSYRMRPIEEVFSEIDKLRLTDILFVDDNIASDIDYFREIIKKMSERKLRWWALLSSDIINHPDIIEKAGKSGCVQLFFGIESINTSSLKTIRKQFNNPEKYIELANILKKSHIMPMFSFMYGLDSDTIGSLFETTEFILKNKFLACINVLTPFPGTELYDSFKKENRIISNNWNLYDATNVVYKPLNFKISELEEIYRKSVQEYYSFKNQFSILTGLFAYVSLHNLIKKSYQMFKKA